jgi:hypothetical protein
VKHEWVSGDSVQWGAQGLDYNSAATPFRCSVCGAKFTHHYHAEPNIYKAMAQAGIDEDGCTSSKVDVS